MLTYLKASLLKLNCQPTEILIFLKATANALVKDVD